LRFPRALAARTLGTPVGVCGIAIERERPGGRQWN